MSAGMIQIELDSVRKNANKSEWRMVNRARICFPGSRTTHIESIGDGDNIRHLCRAMVAAGITGIAEVMRGSTKVFAEPIDVERFANGKWGKGDQPEHLKRLAK